MTFYNLTRTGAVCLSCLALAGCFGSSNSAAVGGGGTGGTAGGGTGSGGSGSGGTASSFKTNFDRLQLQTPTQNEISGSAKYTGQINILTNANASNADESLVGDLNMSVNFDGAGNNISASATNFAGEVDGTAVTVTGTVSSANADASAPNRTSEQVVNIPGQGAATFTGVAVTMDGALSESTGKLSGDAQVTLIGNMVGADGAGTFGAAGVAIKPSTGANILTGGTYYADRN